MTHFLTLVLRGILINVITVMHLLTVLPNDKTISAVAQDAYYLC